jgi:hypothetical protein
MSTLFPTAAIPAAVSAGSMTCGVFSGKSIALAQSVKQGWLLANLKMAAVVICGVSLVAIGTGQRVRQEKQNTPRPWVVGQLRKHSDVQAASAGKKPQRLTVVKPIHSTQQQSLSLQSTTPRFTSTGENPQPKRVGPRPALGALTSERHLNHIPKPSAKHSR